MMRIQSKLHVSLLAALLLAAVAGCSRTKKTPRTFLEGHWTGYDVQQTNAPCSLTVQGLHLEYRGAASNDWCRGTFVLDETTFPIQLNLTLEASPVAEDANKVVLAICDVNGDALKIAAAPPGSTERPDDFTSNQQTRVFSFKRD